jgi:hypothetical protein
MCDGVVSYHEGYGGSCIRTAGVLLQIPVKHTTHKHNNQKDTHSISLSPRHECMDLVMKGEDTQVHSPLHALPTWDHNLVYMNICMQI